MKKIILDYLDKGYPANGSFVEYVGRDVYNSFVNLCKSIYGTKKTILYGVKISHFEGDTIISAGVVWTGEELVTIEETLIADMVYENSLKLVFSDIVTNHAYRDGTSRNTYIEKKGIVASGASEDDPELITSYFRTKPVDEVVTVEFDNYTEHISAGVPRVYGKKTTHRDGLVVIDGFISDTMMLDEGESLEIEVDVKDLNLVPNCIGSRIDIGNGYLLAVGTDYNFEKEIPVSLKSQQRFNVFQQKLRADLSGLNIPLRTQITYTLQFKIIAAVNNMNEFFGYTIPVPEP